MRLDLIALGLIVAAPALADCPTAADLEKGIRFTVDGVDTEEYRQFRPGVIESIYRTEDGSTNRSLLAQGIYVIETVDFVDGEADPDTRATYAFPGAPSELALPEPGGQVVYEIVVNVDGDIRREKETYDFGQAALLNFGACEYEMIPVEIRYDPDDSGTVDILYYLSELGLSYYAGSDYDGGSDRYTYSKIEVIE